MVTPDEPHSNCVRDCLQDKTWNLLANAKRGRKPNDPPMDINFACPTVAVSALVLNFVPDAAAALREMARVTVEGGQVAACLWDYAEKIDLIRSYWDAAAQLGLSAPGQGPGRTFSDLPPRCAGRRLRRRRPAAITGLQAPSVSASRSPPPGEVRSMRRSIVEPGLRRDARKVGYGQSTQYG
jgi:hypothetical protein